jgi:hypothetical protein
MIFFNYNLIETGLAFNYGLQIHSSGAKDWKSYAAGNPSQLKILRSKAQKKKPPISERLFSLLIMYGAS